MPKANLTQSASFSYVPERITKPQQNFLQILLNDCGFGTRDARNVWLSFETSRPIRFIDDLTKEEGRRLIEKLKEHRDSAQNQDQGETDDD